MDNEFLQSVNLELLQQELGRDIQGVSTLLNVSAQTIYKWNREKFRGGCRPTYDTIYAMLNNGASLNSLFGIDAPQQPQKTINQEDFLAGVREALAQLAMSAKEPQK